MIGYCHKIKRIQVGGPQPPTVLSYSPRPRIDSLSEKVVYEKNIDRFVFGTLFLTDEVFGMFLSAQGFRNL